MRPTLHVLPCLLLFWVVAFDGAAAQPSTSLLEAHVAAAQSAQSHQNCRVAAEEYHAAALLMPRSGELRTNEGIALYCDRQFPAAASVFDSALQFNGALSVPHLFLGFVAYKAGDLRRAAKELNVYLARKPDDPTAHLWLGYTLAAQEDWAAASMQYRQVLGEEPHNLDAEYALGEAALSLAHADALAIEKLDPSGSRLLQLAGTRFRMMGDEKRAAAAEEEASRRLLAAPFPSPETAQRLAALATGAQAEQKEALQMFGAIVDQAPDSYRAHEVQGDALVAAQQQPAAIEQYEAVLRLQPDLPGVHETLSQCLMTAGRFADALQALDAELAISPALRPRLETRIGQAKLALGDDAGAAESLQHAVASAAAPPQAFLLLGEVRLRQSRAAEAVPLLQRYLAADAGNATAFYYLSRAYRALGDRPSMLQALADYRRVSENGRDRALTSPVTLGTVASSFAETPIPEIPTELRPASRGTQADQNRE